MRGWAKRAEFWVLDTGVVDIDEEQNICIV